MEPARQGFVTHLYHLLAADSSSVTWELKLHRIIKRECIWWDITCNVHGTVHYYFWSQFILHLKENATINHGQEDSLVTVKRKRIISGL